MNKTKKLVLTICLAVVAIAIIVIGTVLIKNQREAEGDGTIIVEVYALDGSEMAKKSIVFNNGDLLQKLIEDNFDNVVFEDTGYGPFLKAIEGYETPSDWSSYISVYVNDVYATAGIGQIEFVDGTKITLKVETYSA